MRLAKLAIRQPIFISMVLLALTLVGVIAYTRMGVELYPDMSNPTISVSIPFAGASPQDVETLVTKPVEQAFSTVSGVDTISATSREGMSQVTVSFVIGHNIQEGASEIRERLDVVKRRLPDGTDAPILRRFDPNTMPIMNIGLTIGGGLSPADQRRMVEEIVTPRLESLTGIAAATVSGFDVQDVMVDLNASKMKALRVTPQQVVAALQRENVYMPSGQINSTDTYAPLRTAAQFQNVDDVRKLVVVKQGTQTIQLQDVASVELRYPDKYSLVRVNGESTMMISLQKQSGSNVVQAAGLVRDELKKLSSDFPQLKFTIVRDDSTFISDSDHDVTVTLILGAILAAAIVFLFFRNIRNTLITVAGLPIIVVSTFTAMYMLGYTRNLVSLMALSLSVGLLIDDAIVVRENIFRYMEAGVSPKEATEKATGEIALAVLAISLTIVAMFIPVTFTGGQVGRLLNQFGITVAVAVMISLFEAFTFAPLLTAYFAKPLTHEHRTAEKVATGFRDRWARAWPAISDSYRRLLGWSLRHRLAVMAVALITFAISAWLIRFLPTSFFPSTDPSAINIGINLPPGTALNQTDQVARDIEKYAMAQPEVVRVYSDIGGVSSQYSGSITVTLADGTPTEPVIARFRGVMAKYGRTLTFGIPRQFMGAGGGFGGTSVRSRPVVVAVRGPVSIDALAAVADQTIEKLRTVPGLRDVDKSLPPSQPELQIAIDRQRAAQTGVSASTVGDTIRTLVSGTTATQVNWNDQRIDVNVQLRNEDARNPSAIMDLPIAGPTGDLWALRTVAKVEQGTGPTILERQDRQRQILVGANLEGRSQGSVVPDVQKAMGELSLPAGVSWQFAGQQAQTATAFTGLAFALALGLVFIYMVLASQFGSLIHPLTVMMALPLSAIGAMLALVAIHADMTVVAMIGIILLMGLATKNSILLVDFILRYRKEGRERTEAIIAAGPIRLRPILMTTLAVVLGMIPTALGIGAAGAFRAPMAVAVIGGVFSSTLLSLVVVPVFYTIVDDVVIAVGHFLNRTAPVAVAAGQPPGDPDPKR